MATVQDKTSRRTACTLFNGTGVWPIYSDVERIFLHLKLRVGIFGLEPMRGGRSRPQIRGVRKRRFVPPKVAFVGCLSSLTRADAWPLSIRAGPGTERVSDHQTNSQPARSRSQPSGQAAR